MKRRKHARSSQLLRVAQGGGELSQSHQKTKILASSPRKLKRN
jgi:hypothetical protein